MLGQSFLKLLAAFLAAFFLLGLDVLASPTHGHGALHTEISTSLEGRGKITDTIKKKFRKSKKADSCPAPPVVIASSGSGPPPGRAPSPGRGPASGGRRPSPPPGTEIERIWKSLGPTNKVLTGAVKAFPFHPKIAEDFTTSEFYGCTIVVAVDGKGTVIGHFPEEYGKTGKLMDNAAMVEEQVTMKLEKEYIHFDFSDATNLFIWSCATEKTPGIKAIKEQAMKFDIHPANIKYKSYPPSPLGLKTDNTPFGKMVVRSIPDKTGGAFTVQILYQSDKPIFSQRYNAEGDECPE